MGDINDEKYKREKIGEAYKSAWNEEEDITLESLFEVTSSITSAQDDILNQTQKNSGDILESIDKGNDAVINIVENNNNSILSAEKLYSAEKERIDKKRQEEAEETARLEYEIRLAAAKDSAKAAKIQRDEELRLEKLADDAYLDELKTAAKAEAEIRDKEFSDLKRQLDLGYITKSEYYTKLAGLRDKYFDEDSNEWAEYTSQISSYQEKLLDDLNAYIEKSQSEIEKLQNGIKDKLLDYSKLYTTRKVTYKKAGEYGQDLVFTSTHLNDLNAQTKQLREYADALENVKKRGELPQGFFDELKGMSIDEGLKFAKTLLDASDSEFEEYLNSYREMQEEAAKIAVEFTADETSKMINSISSELEKYYESIPQGFFECGKEAGGSFTSAFLKELDGLADGLNALIPNGGNAFSANNIVKNNSYSSTYNLYSTAQTASEQLRQARAYSELEKIRGGY